MGWFERKWPLKGVALMYGFVGVGMALLEEVIVGCAVRFPKLRIPPNVTVNIVDCKM